MTVQPLEIVGSFVRPPLYGDDPVTPFLWTPCPLARSDFDDIVEATTTTQASGRPGPMTLWFDPATPFGINNQTRLLTALGQLEDGEPSVIAHTDWHVVGGGLAMFSLWRLCLAVVTGGGVAGAWVG